MIADIINFRGDHSDSLVVSEKDPAFTFEIKCVCYSKWASPNVVCRHHSYKNLERAVFRPSGSIRSCAPFPFAGCDF